MLDIRPHENKTVIDNLQKVVSAYAKNVDKRGETAKAFLEQSEIMYADKKEPLVCLTSWASHVPWR